MRDKEIHKVVYDAHDRMVDEMRVRVPAWLEIMPTESIRGRMYQLQAPLERQLCLARRLAYSAGVRRLQFGGFDGYV